VVLNSNGTARSRRISYRDVLVEGGCTLDGWLIDTLVLPDGVARSIARDSTFLGTKARSGAAVLDDVVLDQWVGSPSIDRKKTGSAGDTE
jgi:hypothetical protein